MSKTNCIKKYFIAFCLAVFFCQGVLRADDWQKIQGDFADPPLAVKSRPLWFWNKVPNREETISILQACRESGYAGVGILPNFSQHEMRFMSPEYLEQYKVAADCAKELGMKLCLYDEFWYPSGSAGGLLRERYPQYLCKRLEMVETTVDTPDAIALNVPAGALMGCVAMNMRTFARENITAACQDGQLVWQRPGDDADVYKIMAFVCVPDGTKNLVDYLEPSAVRAFIELTYVGYQKVLGEHFGTTIDSAFFDEPTFYSTGGGRAWTPRFNEYFRQTHSTDPVPFYPAMFMDIGDDTAEARNALFGFRAKLFSDAFVKSIADWLEPYNIQLTGHVDQEECVNPTGMCGDMIKFFEHQPIPGVDEIFEYGRGSVAYKLVTSAAINYDRHLIMSEVYGGINDMPVALLYKEVMDQTVKGVNLFVPHAVWYDANPANIIFQPELSSRDALYGPELPAYNRYVGRIQRLMQNPGRTVADIAVLYPIESLQATYHFFGHVSPYIGGVPGDEDNYQRLCEFLTFNFHRDYVYLHPETLQKRSRVVPRDAAHPATFLELKNTENSARFDTLLLPSMQVIGLETLRVVKDFYDRGGRVVAVGRLPVQATRTADDAQVRALLREMFGDEAVEKSYAAMTQKPRVRASSEWEPHGHPAGCAFDGNPETRWNAVTQSGGGQWLEITLPVAAELAKIVIREPFDRVQKFHVEFLNPETEMWENKIAGETIGRWKELVFAAETVAGVRIVFDEISEESTSISEIDFFDSRGHSILHPHAAPERTSHTNAAGGCAFVVHIDPTRSMDDTTAALQKSLGEADVVFSGMKPLPFGTSQGSFAYIHRVIEGRDVYFFSNSTSTSVDTTVSLRGKAGGRFEYWNPHDGTKTPVEHHRVNGRAEMLLRLEPTASVFLIETGGE